MFPTPGPVPGDLRCTAPSASLRLTRVVAASLAIAVAWLGVILALVLSNQFHMTSFAL